VHTHLSDRKASAAYSVRHCHSHIVVLDLGLLVQDMAFNDDEKPAAIPNADSVVRHRLA
jgi:hypothetical protein